MSKILLYNYFRSSASYRVRIALYAKNIPFEYIPVHLLKNGGEQNTESYRSLNPAGEVPTLFYKEHSISQSMAIIQFLEHEFPQNNLLSKDFFISAKMIQFCEGINCTQPYQNLKTLQYLENNLELNETQRQQWLQFWLSRNLESSEKILTKTAGIFCFGDALSIADCFLMPQLFAASRFKVDSAIMEEKYPTLSRVSKNLEKSEVIQKAHPFNQVDTPPELKT